jgi:hypothetical protein
MTLPAKIVLSISNRCKNLCRICAYGGKPPLRFYNAGQTETEKKGLANFFQAIGERTLSITGRDPLRNPDALEVANQFHSGRKEVIINPISFLTVGLGKNARKITRDEAQKLISSTLSEKMKRLCEILSQFDRVTTSCGTLQAPSPEIAQLAYAFFQSKIAPAIKIGSQHPDINEQCFNGKFKEGILVGTPTPPLAVGKLRSKRIREGIAPGLIAPAKRIAVKRFWCGEYDAFTYHFQKDEDGISLYQSICAQVAQTPYVHFKTGLTLEEMATMSPEEITQKLLEEGKRFEQNTVFSFLSKSFCLPLPSIIDRKTHYEKQFELFIQSVEGLIEKETGKKISVVENTSSFTQQINPETAHPCQACNTAGALLHKENIPPQKLEAFLKQAQNRIVQARVRRLLDKLPNPLKGKRD